MNIVLDTNVFISGIFWSGPPSNILNLWQQKKISICVTPSIIEEYTRVSKHLSERYPDVDISPFIRLAMVDAKMLADTTLPEPASRDPDDDKFIAAAIAGKTDAIVSGDQDLLVLKKYLSIPILNAKDFLLLLP